MVTGMKKIDDVAEPYRELITKLLKTLVSTFEDRLVSLVVYGSVARGEAKQYSDLDLLVVIEGLPKSRFSRSELFDLVEDSLFKDLENLRSMGYQVALSPIIKTPEEAQKISPLYLDMVEDAVIVYDKDKFFESVLIRLSEKLKELEAKRIWIGKKWYWRLKKGLKPGEAIIIE